MKFGSSFIQSLGVACFEEEEEEDASTYSIKFQVCQIDGQIIRVCTNLMKFPFINRVWTTF